ncbi:MAG: cation:proton antiporter [Oscillospiraceae bacterium]
MNLLLKLGLIMITGYIGGKLASLVKLPNVTGYLLAGLLLGPSLINLVTVQDSESLSIINDVALSAIAFSIGSEFLIKNMKKLGKSIVIITLLEVVGAVLVVFSIMYYVFRQPFAFSIVIASMSAATAPAATLMVIQQYRASGPLTKTILPVVALDDIFGIIVFGIAIAAAKISEGGAQGFTAWTFLQPFAEIAGSILLGAVLGFALAFVSKRAKNKEELLLLIVAAIVLTTGLCTWLGLSSLLACIMVGSVLFNLHSHPVRISSAIDDFTPPIYLLFFTLAGASLDLKILAQVGLLGIAYILARAAGKMLGAWAGAKVMKSERTVQRNLGLALLPQGGISIGLSVLVRQQLPAYAVPITTTIMFSVLVFETLGPIFAKIAIQKAGEIGGMDKKRSGKTLTKEG